MKNAHYNRVHYIGNKAIVFAGGGAGIGVLLGSVPISLMGIPIGLAVGIALGIWEERQRDNSDQSQNDNSEETV